MLYNPAVMNARPSPRIATPHTDLQALSFAAATVESVQDWAARLPVANTAQTARSLRSATDEIARLDVGYALRLDLLETIRPTLEYICARLDSVVLSTARTDQKVAHFAQRLHANLSVGYKAVIRAAIDDIGLVKAATKDILPLAIHRCLSTQTRILLRSLQSYVAPTDKLWLEMNQLFALTEQLDLRDHRQADSSNQSQEPCTIETVYLRALLLASCKPNQLRHRQLTEIFNVLEIWASLGRVTPAGAEANMVVDLDSDRGPVYRKLTEETHNPRGVNTNVLTFEIEAYLAEMDSKLEIPEYVGVEVL
ncbi:MAG: hypothetical protein O3A63_07405, partial [Proteobacteria bacterium]|nr:hypothetical protein [Pseudomonadota bacterium]